MYDSAGPNTVSAAAVQVGAPLDSQAFKWYMQNRIRGRVARATPVPCALEAIVTLLRMYGKKGSLKLLNQPCEFWIAVDRPGISIPKPERGSCGHRGKLNDCEDRTKRNREQNLADGFRSLPVFPTQGGTTNMWVVDRWVTALLQSQRPFEHPRRWRGKTGVIDGSRLTSLNTSKGHPKVIEPARGHV